MRLNELGFYRKGPFGSSLTKDMFVPYSKSAIKVYEQKNAIQKDYRLGHYYISDTKFNQMQSFVTNPGDIIVSCAGTIGETYQLPDDAPIGIINQALMRVCLYDKSISDYWQMNFDYILLVNSEMKGAGSAIKNIPPFDVLKSLLVPIPPIAEQNRILSQYRILQSKIRAFETLNSELERLNSTIFEKLKKSVLQEAIQGKLVSQDPNDEPAFVLLERIKAEKAKLFKEGKSKKKDLVDSVIFKGEDNKYYEKIGSEVTCIDDEIPFEIPDSWAWIRLGNIFQHNTGKALNGSNQRGVFYDYITTSNLYWNSFVLGKLRSMPFTDDELDKCTVKKGDLLVCEGGDIGRSAIWNYDYDIRIQNHIHRLRAYTPICTMFVYYTLYLYKHTGLIGGKGIGIQGLSSNALHKLLLPLPSIAEQKRIVDKVEFVIASIMRR